MVQTEQLAVLAALVIAANLVLLGALALPRLAAMSIPRVGLTRRAPPIEAQRERAGGMAPEASPTGRMANLPEPPTDTSDFPTATYERVVRVVAALFIGAVLVVVTIAGTAGEPGVYLLLALGIFMVVLAQDVLPLERLGRWRFTLEAMVATVLISLLVLLTGGYQSPFFFGYLLIVAGGSVRARGIGPLLLTMVISGAYLLAVLLAPVPPPATPDVVAQITFNLVALALVSYIGSVLGREQRNAREAALRLSRFDTLTGLHSRDHVLAVLEQETLRAARSDRPFGLLMIDLDGLKPVNDRYGHETGDRLLRGLGDVIRADIRATDVGARYGGDEFVIVLPDTDLAGTLRVGEKVRADIGRFSVPQDGGFARTSASVGLVTYPEDGRTTSELMRRADLAMYEAKRRGRDQIVRYAREPGDRVAVRVGEQWDGDRT